MKEILNIDSTKKADHILKMPWLWKFSGFCFMKYIHKLSPESVIKSFIQFYVFQVPYF